MKIIFLKNAFLVALIVVTQVLMSCDDELPFTDTEVVQDTSSTDGYIFKDVSVGLGN
jgi:hypothetical protein